MARPWGWRWLCPPCTSGEAIAMAWSFVLVHSSSAISISLVFLLKWLSNPRNRSLFRAVSEYLICPDFYAAGYFIILVMKKVCLPELTSGDFLRAGRQHRASTGSGINVIKCEYVQGTYNLLTFTCWGLNDTECDMGWNYIGGNVNLLTGKQTFGEIPTTGRDVQSFKKITSLLP